MDTGTHIVMGVALGGLALVDPVVYSSPVTAQTVMIATIIGSQIPDIDTVLKLKNNAIYIRNHRGITHSIPAVFLWPLLIVAVLYPLFPEANLFHLWLWTFIAVFLHVFVDIFNAYGTQALRPFTHKWVALGWINTFDKYIFGIHCVGLLLWLFGLDPRMIFPIIYIVIIGYYLYRLQVRSILCNLIKEQIGNTEKIILSPTTKLFRWRFAVIADDKFYVGRAVKKDEIEILDEYQRIPLPDNPIMNAARKDVNAAAFLSFSPIYRWEIDEGDLYNEVRFIDLRYRSNGHYPFIAVVQLNHDLEVISSYTGWIYNKQKLRKKLEFIPG